MFWIVFTFYTSEVAWIFNPPFPKPWINILVWYSNKQSSKIISRAGLDNLAQQVYYYAY